MSMGIGKRIVVAALSLSAAGLGVTALNEGWAGKATIPVAGDPPTAGLGSTTKENGQPFKLGESITPPQAIRLAVRDIAKKEVVLRECFAGSSLHQYEWDAYVDLSYNVGPGAVCNSSIPIKVKAEQYEAACRTILDYRKVHGRDCSAPANASYCGGVWTRRQTMAHQCLTGERP